MLSPDASWAVQPDWLRWRSLSHPERLALIAGSERWSFAELDRRVHRAAQQLAALGVDRGARVALLCGGASFVALTHALVRLGAVMVPLHTRLTQGELAWQLADCRARLLICDPDHAAKGAEAAGAVASTRMVLAADGCLRETGRLDGGDDADGALAGLTPIPEADLPFDTPVGFSDVQGLIYTSGTTGWPKGAMLTYGNHWWNAIGSVLNLGLHRDDRWLAPLPLYHVGGLAILWRSVIYGIPAVVRETFEPEVVNRDIAAEEVTMVSVVSTMLQQMLEAWGPRPYPPNLRCVLLGGGPIPPALVETCLQRKVPIAPTYGLTETASQVATLPPQDVPGRPESVGKALFPLDLLINADQSLANGERITAAPLGQVGEILVRGPTVMRGYVGRPEETAHVLSGGWLHTADLGYLDDAGYLYVADRRDDLIITGGENVSPAEVERVLLEHPGVEDCAVFALADSAWGQIVAAAIKPRRGAAPTAEDLGAFCARRLAQHKIPRHLWFVDALPRSSGGKLLRRTLREQIGDLYRPPKGR